MPRCEGSTTASHPPVVHAREALRLVTDPVPADWEDKGT